MADRPKSSHDDQIQNQEYGTVPPHFYRELTRTVEGCQLLKESGHFDAFATSIRDTWSEHEDPETILKLKGSLWAVGNVGAMELGAPFLEESDVVDSIVRTATLSEVMTIRGTAFFVLGLISRSLHGMEILAEHGWNAATDHLGRSLGYCLPPDLGVLLSVREYRRRCLDGADRSYRCNMRGLSGRQSGWHHPVGIIVPSSTTTLFELA